MVKAFDAQAYAEARYDRVDTLKPPHYVIFFNDTEGVKFGYKSSNVSYIVTDSVDAALRNNALDGHTLQFAALVYSYTNGNSPWKSIAEMEDRLKNIQRRANAVFWGCFPSVSKEDTRVIQYSHILNSAVYVGDTNFRNKLFVNANCSADPNILVRFNLLCDTVFSEMEELKTVKRVNTELRADTLNDVNIHFVNSATIRNTPLIQAIDTYLDSAYRTQLFLIGKECDFQPLKQPSLLQLLQMFVHAVPLGQLLVSPRHSTSDLQFAGAGMIVQHPTYRAVKMKLDKDDVYRFGAFLADFLKKSDYAAKETCMYTNLSLTPIGQRRLQAASQEGFCDKLNLQLSTTFATASVFFLADIDSFIVHIIVALLNAMFGLARETLGMDVHGYVYCVIFMALFTQVCGIASSVSWNPLKCSVTLLNEALGSIALNLISPLHRIYHTAKLSPLQSRNGTPLMLQSIIVASLVLHMNRIAPEMFSLLRTAIDVVSTTAAKEYVADATQYIPELADKVVQCFPPYIRQNNAISSLSALYAHHWTASVNVPQHLELPDKTDPLKHIVQSDNGITVTRALREQCDGVTDAHALFKIYCNTAPDVQLQQAFTMWHSNIGDIPQLPLFTSRIVRKSQFYHFLYQEVIEPYLPMDQLTSKSLGLPKGLLPKAVQSIAKAGGLIVQKFLVVQMYDTVNGLLETINAIVDLGKKVTKVVSTVVTKVLRFTGTSREFVTKTFGGITGVFMGLLGYLQEAIQGNTTWDSFAEMIKTMSKDPANETAAIILKENESILKWGYFKAIFTALQEDTDTNENVYNSIISGRYTAAEIDAKKATILVMGIIDHVFKLFRKTFMRRTERIRAILDGLSDTQSAMRSVYLQSSLVAVLPAFAPIIDFATQPAMIETESERVDNYVTEFLDSSPPINADKKAQFIEYISPAQT